MGKGIENLFNEVKAENLPSLGKNMDIQIQEAQKFPNRFKPNRSSPRNVIVKLPQVKSTERILNIAKEKHHVTYKKIPNRKKKQIDFPKSHIKEYTYKVSAEILKARREWDDVFKVLKEQNCQLRVLYSAKLFFKNEGETALSRQARTEGMCDNLMGLMRNP